MKILNVSISFIYFWTCSSLLGHLSFFYLSWQHSVCYILLWSLKYFNRKWLLGKFWRKKLQHLNQTSKTLSKFWYILANQSCYVYYLSEGRIPSYLNPSILIKIREIEHFKKKINDLKNAYKIDNWAFLHMLHKLVIRPV